MKNSVLTWLDERLGLPELREMIAHKTVPVHVGSPGTELEFAL